jgi:hypothetical protein
VRPCILEFLLLFLPAFSIAANRAAPPVVSPTPRTSNWTCELNGYSSPQAKLVAGKVSIQGEGVFNCKNPTGFATEIPAKIHFNVKYTPGKTDLSKVRFSLSSSEPFGISNEVYKLGGLYELTDDPISMVDKNQVEMTFRNSKRTVVLPIKLEIPEESEGDWKIISMVLDFSQ